MQMFEYRVTRHCLPCPVTLNLNCHGLYFSPLISSHFPPLRNSHFSLRPSLCLSINIFWPWISRVATSLAGVRQRCSVPIIMLYQIHNWWIINITAKRMPLRKFVSPMRFVVPIWATAGELFIIPIFISLFPFLPILVVAAKGSIENQCKNYK